MGRCIGGLAVAMFLMWSAIAGAETNPRALIYELIDQLQTGQPRSIDIAPAMRKVIADQTGNSGVYQSLARLGIVTYVRIETTTPMRRGTLYTVTATHDKGVSNWQVGIAADTQRIEYLEFKVAKGTAPAESTARPSQTEAKPLAPRGDTGPSPALRPAPQPAPQPAPRTATPAETSAACQKFPNLC